MKFKWETDQWGHEYIFLGDQPTKTIYQYMIIDDRVEEIKEIKESSFVANKGNLLSSYRPQLFLLILHTTELPSFSFANVNPSFIVFVFQLLIVELLKPSILDTCSVVSS